MKLCGHCRNRGKNSRCNLYTEISNYAEKCKDFKPKKQTNADRIRSMSDEELADFIRELNEVCLAGAGKVDCSKNEECIDCKGVVLKWLQSEVEE